ncbi:hypothetical protein M9458_054595 [Cirrhinus mrigala]|uniref:Uncharacterized protein n=1 Tax=Cirrhinus mrigala TaxID=683832 RepID=A0ABD0MPV4_CIRMR
MLSLREDDHRRVADSVSCKGGGCRFLCPDLEFPLGKCQEGTTSGRELTSNGDGEGLPKNEGSSFHRKVPLISFGASSDDRMSIAVSESEPTFRGRINRAHCCPPSGQHPVHSPEVLKELRITIDLALCALKVTMWSLGHAMSTMLVQECYLWLWLADMRETDKTRFLSAPVSQTGFSGDAVENFAQQFSASQKQTEAHIRHILSRHAAPQPAHRRGWPPDSAPAQPSQRPFRQPPHPSRPPLRPVASGRERGSETAGPGEWHLDNAIRCTTRTQGKHISTKSCPSGCPCHPMPLRKSQRRPLFPSRAGRSHSQLTRQLADTGLVSGSVVRTQGPGVHAPQLVGSSGQLGKEQTLPDKEDLFSWYGVGLGRTDIMPHAGTCPVSVELPEYVQEQDSGPTEISEAPTAYGSCSDSYTARAAPYETASTLAPRPSPKEE